MGNAVAEQATVETEDAPVVRHFVARLGSFMLDLEEGGASSEKIHERLLEALSEDNRVTVIEPGSADHEWTTKQTLYPSERRIDPDALLSGESHFHSLRFSDALMFEVHVPGKNQPVIHGETPEVDTYFVAWDGCTAVVMWEVDSPALPANRAAGQVVVEILKQASQSSKLGLYVQACSPACKHLFAHKDLQVDWLEASEYEPHFEVADAEGDVRLVIEGPLVNELELVEAVHDEVKEPAAEFAELKNVARRVLDLEDSARSMSFDLIHHDYETLRRSRRGFWARVGYAIGEAWMAMRGEGRGRAANLLIASLWLAMANMETLQQRFRDIERRYQESVSKWAVPALFATDLKSEEAEVSTLDAHFARATVEHKSSRMDNRVIVWATVGGALAGAGVTATVAALLTALK